MLVFNVNSMWVSVWVFMLVLMVALIVFWGVAVCFGVEFDADVGVEFAFGVGVEHYAGFGVDAVDFKDGVGFGLWV